MKQTRLTIVLVAGLTLATAAAVPAAAGGGKPQKKTVKIADNYYSPTKLAVNKGSTITWKWPDTTGDTHDVLLDKGPKGVKKFQSESAGSFYSYKQKLKVPGEYKIICTLHEQEMKMTIRVRK
ncbi:cupredoxin domain-containing protein [Svornostia abyssi]|uniref:Cupredoxin domain-containing protein n=1 Tax=Svornostia abyssi TaxID=2898438 RepID=A0ABY5PFB9_9ACTN|nr:cupredoxin domain-containing protein [Parviterribacteraceae bacterium J379]